VSAGAGTVLQPVLKGLVCTPKDKWSTRRNFMPRRERYERSSGTRSGGGTYLPIFSLGWDAQLSSGYAGRLAWGFAAKSCGTTFVPFHNNRARTVFFCTLKCKFRFLLG
ncbi:unnamed protein product, partial [Scytosiphon promiscuus]